MKSVASIARFTAALALLVLVPISFIPNYAATTSYLDREESLEVFAYSFWVREGFEGVEAIGLVLLGTAGVILVANIVSVLRSGRSFRLLDALVAMLLAGTAVCLTRVPSTLVSLGDVKAVAAERQVTSGIWIDIEIALGWSGWLMISVLALAAGLEAFACLIPYSGRSGIRKREVESPNSTGPRHQSSKGLSVTHDDSPIPTSARAPSFLLPKGTSTKLVSRVSRIVAFVVCLALIPISFIPHFLGTTLSTNLLSEDIVTVGDFWADSMDLLQKISLVLFWILVAALLINILRQARARPSFVAFDALAATLGAAAVTCIALVPDHQGRIAASNIAEHPLSEGYYQDYTFSLGWSGWVLIMTLALVVVLTVVAAACSFLGLSASEVTAADRLGNIENLHQQGLISDDERQEQRKRILDLN